MPRNISAAARRAIESPNSVEAFILMVTINHPNLETPIYVNSDVVDYMYGGNRFIGCAFNLKLPTDDDQPPPKAQVSIRNVDAVIGLTILSLTSAPIFSVDLVAKSSFTDDVPRQPIGTPAVLLSAQGLTLQNVQCDEMQISADLVGFDISTENFPAIRSTQDRLPGLYR